MANVTGEIIIDEISTANIKLETLRSGMSVIPQVMAIYVYQIDNSKYFILLRDV